MPEAAQMRAFVLTEKGEGPPGKCYHPASVQNVPIPASDGLVLVKIDYAAMNHRDLFIRRSLYPGIVWPSILGSDAVGTVVEPSSHALHGKRVLVASTEGWLSSELGPDVPERPFGMLGGVKQTGGRGTFAEYIAVLPDHLVELPEHLHENLAAAAAIPLGGVTAFRAVFTKCRVERGANVLITGIGGGVAIQAMQFVIAAGANVWVTSGDEQKIDKAVQLGAKGGVSYKEEGWAKKLQALLPKERPELDSVIDSGGGPILGAVSRFLKVGGIVTQYGSTTMQDTPVSITAILKNQELKGTTMGSLDEFKRAVAFIGEHKIVPIVDTVIPSLEQLEDGFKLIDEGKHFGKVVVKVAEGAKGKL